MSAPPDPVKAVSDAALVLGRIQGVLEGLAQLAAGELFDHQREAVERTLRGFKAEAEPVIWAAFSCAMAHPEHFRIHLEKQFAERQHFHPPCGYCRSMGGECFIHQSMREKGIPRT